MYCVLAKVKCFALQNMYTQVTAKTKETRRTVDNEWASKCVSHTQSVTQTNAKPDENFCHESATNMQKVIIIESKYLERKGCLRSF